MLGLARIEFVLPIESLVDAEIFDVSGREVRGIAHGSRFTAGVHELRWDGRDANGSAAASGIYFIRIRAGHESAVKRIVKLR
jgi:flagellar hook assembly protein FlgD